MNMSKVDQSCCAYCNRSQRGSAATLHSTHDHCRLFGQRMKCSQGFDSRYEDHGSRSCTVHTYLSAHKT